MAEMECLSGFQRMQMLLYVVRDLKIKSIRKSIREVAYAHQVFDESPHPQTHHTYMLQTRRVLIAEYFQWKTLHFRMSQQMFLSDPPYAGDDNIPKPRRDKSERK
ncbi:hypothetical protein LINGRAHAP2_LOCUS22430, partial [Linum grandiflorum]